MFIEKMYAYLPTKLETGKWIWFNYYFKVVDLDRLNNGKTQLDTYLMPITKQNTYVWKDLNEYEN